MMVETPSKCTLVELVARQVLCLAKCPDRESLWSVAVRALLFVSLMIWYYCPTLWPAPIVRVLSDSAHVERLAQLSIDCLASTSLCLWYEVLYLWLVMVHRSEIKCKIMSTKILSNVLSPQSKCLLANLRWLYRLPRCPTKCILFDRVHI